MSNFLEADLSARYNHYVAFYHRGLAMPVETITTEVVEKNLLETTPLVAPVEEVLEKVRLDCLIAPDKYLEETLAPDGGE